MKAKYQLIADDIRSKILSNEYVVGAVIPPELQLQKDYGVSRHTVRQAIALLVNEGYLRSEKGSGTYVDDAFQAEVRASGKKTIGVITTYLSDYIFPAIIRGIEQELREKGYSLLLASTNNDPLQEKECLERMLAQGVQGLIVEPTKSNQFNPNLALYLSFKERNIPIVMINAYYEELDIPHICVNDTKAGLIATEYLMSQGHKDLALVTKIDDLQGKYRMKGFIKAHDKNRLPMRAEHLFTYTTETKETIAKKVLDAMLKEEERPTAVVCYNDEIANQMVEEINKQGYRVPEDFSVIGEDDSYLSLIGEVALSTVTHPKETMGLAAADWIIQAIETGEMKENIYYEPQLVLRNSVEKLN
ncbi:GntR family transcriptional regulator [Enterococcus sp. JM4C]|uniref:GntR family transcriptional regulator n=1 Tax=Candidatus Enterococcus huntleyi TaxID=1857217 RepID=UPI001379B1E0|nr:GntR family transcriptional regulator [Enterococcus sp. JM4C]KAF1296234.1 GntR family transcriptional regulator [Enterococcus sp. JM4C]